MAKMKDALLNLQRRSINLPEFDGIEPSPEALDLAWAEADGALTKTEIRRFAAGIDRFFGEGALVVWPPHRGSVCMQMEVELKASTPGGK